MTGKRSDAAVSEGIDDLRCHPGDHEERYRAGDRVRYPRPKADPRQPDARHDENEGS